MINQYRGQTPVEFSKLWPHNRGLTLIDVIVGITLMLIVFLGIFGAYSLGLKVVGLSKSKIEATALANQWVEIIRNLPYQSVGTKRANLPQAEGILEPITTVTRNNIEYTISIKVRYIVDSADGLVAPEDDCYLDYKRVEVRVFWSGLFGGEVKLVTDVAPKNKIEETNTCLAQPGGILSVLVFDAYGQMVDYPLIEIFNPETEEKITSYSPSTGKYDFPLAASTYKVVVSKPSYSSERTYGNEIATPEKPHPIVLEGQLTEISFSIDRVSSLNVEVRGSKDAGYPVVHNVTFNLRGEKIIGLDVQENSVYKYSKTQTTNGAGEITISNLEWDSYYFSVITPDLNLIEIESPPGTTTTQPIALAPNTNLTVRLILSAENSLLVTVQNIETLEPVFSATVRLFNTALGQDITQYTDENGQTYFIPLQEAVYNLEVTAAGYSSVSDQVSVSGETTRIIQLQQLE